MRKPVLVISFIFLSLFSFGQVGLEFNEAKRLGLVDLDSIYMSAIHSDTTKAVFKTERERENLIASYHQMLKDFGKFLSENNFEWKNKTLGFNRVYFNENGKIDYFLFSFRKSEHELTEHEHNEFQRLLNLFVKDYQFPLTADTKFVQCSPVTYLPQKE